MKPFIPPPFDPPFQHPTPRTDAESEHAENVALYLQCRDDRKWPHGSEVVRADFARGLETELVCAQILLKNTMKNLVEYMEIYETEFGKKPSVTKEIEDLKSQIEGLEILTQHIPK